ncbi:hypothetical protein CR513_41337, partial [Mucuna pruriens]
MVTRASSRGNSVMGTTKFDVEKFVDKNDFSLRRIEMKALLVHQGLGDALVEAAKIILPLDDEVPREIDETTIVRVWLKLESLYMNKTSNSFAQVKWVQSQPNKGKRFQTGLAYKRGSRPGPINRKSQTSSLQKRVVRLGPV